MEQERQFKINNFDLIRLFAATQVIGEHYNDHISKAGNKTVIELLFFFPGLTIFFMISGYLVSTSYQSSKTIKNYITNRAFRIYPGLWVCIGLTILTFSLTGANFLNKEAMVWLPSQLAGFIYTPNFLDNYGFGSYNGSLWTLTIELQFYVALPICYFFFAAKKQANNWFFALFVLFSALYFVCQAVPFSDQVQKMVRYSFIPHFYLFLLGVIFQRTRIFKSNFIYNKGLYWLALCILFCFSFHNILGIALFNYIRNILLACCALSMAYTLPGIAKKILRGTDMSYGIYVYHGLLMAIIVQLNWQTHFNLLSIVVMAYIIGYLSWISIEKPFIKLKHNLQYRPPAV